MKKIISELEEILKNIRKVGIEEHSHCPKCDMPMIHWKDIEYLIDELEIHILIGLKEKEKLHK